LQRFLLDNAFMFANLSHNSGDYNKKSPQRWSVKADLEQAQEHPKWIFKT